MTGAEVILIREKLKLTQEQLAVALNVSFATVSRWENERAKPTGTALTILEVMKKAADKPHIADTVKDALLFKGVAYMFYKLLQAVFEDERLVKSDKGFSKRR